MSPARAGASLSDWAVHSWIVAVTSQIRAVLEGPTGIGGFTKAVTAKVDRDLGGTRDATAPVGPGTVNLLTGNMTISRSDVSVPSFGSNLEFARTHNSRDSGGEPGVLGPGWKPSVPVEAAGGSDWESIYDAQAAQEGPYVILRNPAGAEYAFEAQAPGAAYLSPDEAKDLVLTKEGTTFFLKDPGGNQTTFSGAGAPDAFLSKPTAVTQTGGSGNKTKMVYALTGGQRRLTKVIAPTPAGVAECTDTNALTTPGCRALTFEYQDAYYWNESFSGDRLATIKLHAATSASAMGQWAVAQYTYDGSGRLTEAWDPRISPALKERYAYDPAGRILTTVTPPGEESWTLEYGPIASDAGQGRLLRVKRPTLSSPSVAQTTIVYGVAVGGAGAPYEMGGSEIARWGQSDIPTDATAIFPPDQVPASPPTSYSRAAVSYLDAEGMQVNQALPAGAGSSGAPISTTETDTHGNVVRELTPVNRVRALASGGGSKARADELSTTRIFSGDGRDLLDERGPLHTIKREDTGAVVQARKHTTVQYNADRLPSQTTIGASIPGVGTDADQRVTTTEYHPTLRQPTLTTVDPGGKNLQTRIAYGLVTERSLPENPNGGDARTTTTAYYTADGSSPDPSCRNRPNWANLPCRVGPAAQPATAPDRPALPVTTFSDYNHLWQTTQIEGGTGSSTRVTSTSYDAAGREAYVRRSGPSDGGAIQGIQTSYSSTNGKPTSRNFVAPDCEENCDPSFDEQRTTTTYDTLGRVTQYQDADGNTATTSYDFLGRPVTTNDGKGTQTRTYDPTTGLLTQLDDSATGTFTASYDADGAITAKTYPNGLRADTTLDETRTPTRLKYEKTTNCSANCTWFDFQVKQSIHGQWLDHTSNLSSQQYSYDKAGRLEVVKDTPNGQGCTTRSYSFDRNSNRTSLLTRGPAIGGACDTTSAGQSRTSTYDTADRLIGPTYDSHGRTTSLPATDAGGGTLTTSYYWNDLVRSQTQDGITNSYALDADLRQRQRTQTGTTTATEVYHYADGSDSPAWTENGPSSWTRNVVGIDGDLAAVQPNNGTGTKLQLTNLHGDIIAAASLDSAVSRPLETFESDEYGSPKQSKPPKYSWLGGKQRRTELKSGVIQNGRTKLRARARALHERRPGRRRLSQRLRLQQRRPHQQLRLGRQVSWRADWS